jgi:hypothetical protein
MKRLPPANSTGIVAAPGLTVPQELLLRAEEVIE